jgi:hypothetical protein
VTLSVKLDGQEVIHAIDNSGEALTGAGAAGMFDYNGSGQRIDSFIVTQP